MHGPILTLTVRPSRWLRIANLALHSFAAVAVLLADMAGWLQAMLSVGIGSSLVLGLAKRPPLEIRTETDGSLLVKVGEDWQPVEILPSTVVTPWLTALHYRQTPGRARACVVLPDNLPADDFRRFRVWLKWKARIAGNTPDVDGSPATFPSPKN